LCVSLGDTTGAIGKSGAFPFPQEDRPALEEPGWIIFVATKRISSNKEDIQPGNKRAYGL
jgi:hypothetical protein